MCHCTKKFRWLKSRQWLIQNDAKPMINYEDASWLRIRGLGILIVAWGTLEKRRRRPMLREWRTAIQIEKKKIKSEYWMWLKWITFDFNLTFLSVSYLHVDALQVWMKLCPFSFQQDLFIREWNRKLWAGLSEINGRF